MFLKILPVEPSATVDVACNAGACLAAACAAGSAVLTIMSPLTAETAARTSALLPAVGHDMCWSPPGNSLPPRHAKSDAVAGGTQILQIRSNNRTETWPRGYSAVVAAPGAAAVPGAAAEPCEEALLAGPDRPRAGAAWQYSR